MFCVLDDMIVEITVDNDGDDTTIKVVGFDGNFWEDLLPKMLSSTDPNAAEVISELLIWLEANNVKNEQPDRSSRDNRDSSVHGNHTSGNSEAGAGMKENTSYKDKITETLNEFKNAQGVRMVQAMAGNIPILIYKTITDTYCFSFPPDTVVYTTDDIKEMARTGKYTFGKRYMDKLLEVLCGA